MISPWVPVLLCCASLAAAVNITGYEFIVVGSGAGGGPLAARLALAGHKTLLIEAGDDQGANVNVTVPAYSARSTEDEALAWNFFVRHYADDARQARDFKTTYDTPDGKEYTGLDPPPGSTIKGTLYPRSGTLGGCTAHNALVAVYPHRSDFDNLAALTGDASWSANNMRRYFVRMERNRYLLPGSAPGHGRHGWLGTQVAPLNLPIRDTQLLNLYAGAALALGSLTQRVVNLITLVAGDANADSRLRDTDSGYYRTPLSSEGGVRSGSRGFIVAVRDAKNADGSKQFPLDVRMNCHVTKVVFDESAKPPRATGVEFLDGKYLYRASPRSHTAGPGRPGSASASREVIVAGGTYNSPQLLKLSGIGPAEELERFGIPIIADSPGVGQNLQDHYEVAVQGKVPRDFATLRGCTFNDVNDPCLERWKNPVLRNAQAYISNGLGASILLKTSAAVNDDYDAFLFGGPVNFRGYFPGYGVNITDALDWFTWAILKPHPRNRAGSVKLRSADPLDVPTVAYNYFETGGEDPSTDLQAMREAIALARSAFRRQLVPVQEVLPGPETTSDEDLDEYIRDTAWGHHASSTCPIGVDGDRMAVLDSGFRVRGVSGLRVVDASVYPRIPGSFTAVSTYMVGEKAADVILNDISETQGVSGNSS